MMLYQHTKFRYKRFRFLEDILTNINWNFEPLLWPWPRTQSSISLDTYVGYDTGHSSWWWSVIKLSLVVKEWLVPRSVGSKWILTSCQLHRVNQDNQILSKTNASFKTLLILWLKSNPWNQSLHKYKKQDIHINIKNIFLMS